jgi:hypothetical protein
VYHLEWLANLVHVRKKNKEWRMCVDYTDLNKHCPKGLPRIDEVIDFTAGCELLCFLDCYSSYHQIALKEEDQIKTSFIMPFGAYCYMTMSFRLKNAGATYQRAIQHCLKNQIGKNIEAYIDDVVVKSKTTDTLIADLTKTFKALKVYQWKLNPTKCIFGVSSGILLGNIISHHGIEANLENKGDDQDETTNLCQGRPKTNRVHGGLESFHIPSKRKGTPLLQAAQGS